MSNIIEPIDVPGQQDYDEAVKEVEGFDIFIAFLQLGCLGYGLYKIIHREYFSGLCIGVGGAVALNVGAAVHRYKKLDPYIKNKEEIEENA